jgi:hypothetical protein
MEQVLKYGLAGPAFGSLILSIFCLIPQSGARGYVDKIAGPCKMIVICFSTAATAHESWP